jgi:hypothetical protein
VKVFVSAFGARTTHQESAVRAILKAVRSVELEPRLMAAEECWNERRLAAITQVMSECSGALVIAYRSQHFEVGTEQQSYGPEPIVDIGLPSVWRTTVSGTCIDAPSWRPAFPRAPSSSDSKLGARASFRADWRASKPPAAWRFSHSRSLSLRARKSPAVPTSRFVHANGQHAV